MGNAIPTPIAGEPDIAPINKGTIMAIASTGTPDAITTSKRVVTDPVVSIISLRYNMLIMDNASSHLTPFLNISKPFSGFTFPNIIATNIPARSDPQIGVPRMVKATVTRIGTPPIMLSRVKSLTLPFFLGVLMNPLLAMNPIAVITKNNGD